MSQKSNTKEFIKKATLIHSDEYDYSLVNYETALKKVIIICKEHGAFKITPNKHLTRKSGCAKCGIIKKSKLQLHSLDQFLEKAKKVHKNLYTYNIEEYKGSNSRIEIKCNKHGLFFQVVKKHLSGDGCPKCGNETISLKASKNPTGWSYENWEKAAKISKNFDSFKVYILECWNDEERFYKIGRTFLSLKKRFHNKKSMPYNYKILETYEKDYMFICNLEKELKSKNKDFQYVPKLKFNGMYECFYNLININLQQ